MPAIFFDEDPIGTHLHRLWFTDGTAAGTQELASSLSPLTVSPPVNVAGIARHINGNFFTDPSQIPTSHTADGSLLMDLGAGANGEEQVLLVGVSSISSSAISLL